MKTEISVGKLILLHLYPGLLILVIYLLLTPIINGAGFPSVMSLMISFLLVIVPFELGFLLNERKKVSGKHSLQEILVNEPVSWEKIVGIVVCGIIFSILIVGVTQLIDKSVKENLFSWLPDWYFYDQKLNNGYTKNALLITGIARLLIDGLVIPYVEEIYFRGYLLPRISGKGLKVPLMASMLFAIYHFWQPWNYPSLLVISMILVLPAWYFKNYKISLYLHMALNLLGAIVFLVMINR